MSVSTFVCAGSLCTGNELGKCFMLFSHLSLQCLYLVDNDTFVLHVDCVYGEIENSIGNDYGTI